MHKWSLYISDVMRLCGGLNAFVDLPTLTAKIDMEAVLQVNPVAIVAAGVEDSGTLDGWYK
ncbi:MAG: hypothetical protein ACE5NW_13945 [Acidiferrobacterales bacterium]